MVSSYFLKKLIVNKKLTKLSFNILDLMYIMYYIMG